MYFFIPNSVSLTKITKILESERHSSGHIIFRDKFLYDQWACIPHKNKIKAYPISSFKFFNCVIFFFFLIKAKLSNSKVIIFHECCWETLDVLLLIFKPDVLYFPEYKLGKNYVEIKSSEASSLKIKIIRKLPFAHEFRHYKRTLDNGAGIGEVSSASHNYPAQSLLKTATSENIYHSNTEEGIFLIGTTVLSESDEIKLMNSIVKEMKYKKIRFAVKDHPNPRFRNSSRLKHIDSLNFVNPLIPVELISHQYKFCISLSSTGVEQFKHGAIALGMLDERSAAVTDFLNHLKSNCSKNTKFLQNNEDLNNFLSNFQSCNDP